MIMRSYVCRSGGCPTPALPLPGEPGSRKAGRAARHAALASTCGACGALSLRPSPLSLAVSCAYTRRHPSGPPELGRRLRCARGASPWRRTHSIGVRAYALQTPSPRGARTRIASTGATLCSRSMRWPSPRTERRTRDAWAPPFIRPRLVLVRVLPGLSDSPSSHSDQNPMTCR
jgi:hypothetical protein